MFRFVIGCAAAVWTIKNSLELDKKYHFSKKAQEKYNAIKNEYFSNEKDTTSSKDVSTAYTDH